MPKLIESQPAHAGMSSDGVFRLEYGDGAVHPEHPEVRINEADDGTFAQDALEMQVLGKKRYNKSIYREGESSLRIPSHPARKPKTKR